MSQRSQIEWLKFGRLRNKPLMLCVPGGLISANIIASASIFSVLFLSFDQHRRSSVPYEVIIISYFLSRNLMFVISWRKFGRRVRSSRENSNLEFAPPTSMLWPLRLSPDSRPIMPNNAQKFGQIIRNLTQLSRCTKLGDASARRLPFKCKSDTIRNGRKFTSSRRNLAIFT